MIGTGRPWCRWRASIPRGVIARSGPWFVMTGTGCRHRRWCGSRPSTASCSGLTTRNSGGSWRGSARPRSRRHYGSASGVVVRHHRLRDHWRWDLAGRRGRGLLQQERVRMTLVTDNGGPFPSFRFEHVITAHPELRHVRVPRPHTRPERRPRTRLPECDVRAAPPRADR